MAPSYFAYAQDIISSLISIINMHLCNTGHKKIFSFNIHTPASPWMGSKRNPAIRSPLATIPSKAAKNVHK